MTPKRLPQALPLNINPHQLLEEVVEDKLKKLFVSSSDILIINNVLTLLISPLLIESLKLSSNKTARTNKLEST